MSRLRLESDGDVDMSIPQPIYEYIAPPKMEAWDQAALVKWRRSRWQYDERVKERCRWTNETNENIVAGIRSTIDADLLQFLAQYEFNKDKHDITDDEIMDKVKERCETMNDTYIGDPMAVFRKNLKMDLSVTDIPSRVSKYFMLFDRLVEDHGFQENLSRGHPSDGHYTARMKERTRILSEHLMPTMLREEIQGMLKQIKYKHIRSNDQLLYKLVLERAQLQQLFYNRFKGVENTAGPPKGGGRKVASEAQSGTRLRRPSASRGPSRPSAAPVSAASGQDGAGIGKTTRIRAAAPRDGCLHCKGDHWLRDCPAASSDQKIVALTAQRERSQHVKRATVMHQAGLQRDNDEMVRAKGAAMHHPEYTALVNGAVEIALCPDTGADCSIIPIQAIQRVRRTGKSVVTEELQNPIMLRVAGGQQIKCDEKALVDLQIRTSAGPVNLHNVECLVIGGDDDQLLLGKDVMKRLGIDVKHALKQFANSSIELNNDDIPQEPEVGENADAEILVEMKRMCDEVRATLKDAPQSKFYDDLVRLHEKFLALWRIQLGPDEPAIVEPLRVTLVEGAQPVRCKPRRYPPAQLRFLEEHVALLLKYGFIRKNNHSHLASNTLPVRKSDDPTQFRVTSNYIEINKRTVPIAGTIPHFSVILGYVAQAKYFAKFDMFKGFWQMELAPECQEFFSFMTHDGVYTPLRVPQGATDSALHFQSQMQSVYKPLLYKGALIWVHDVIVYGKTKEEFMSNLRQFYELTTQHRLKLNAKKSVFLCFEVTWCGRVLDGSGIRQDPARLAALVALPLPDSAGDPQRFLCASNWIRDSIVDYAREFEPLYAKLNAALANRSRSKRSARATTHSLGTTRTVLRTPMLCNASTARQNCTSRKKIPRYACSPTPRTMAGRLS